MTVSVLVSGLMMSAVLLILALDDHAHLVAARDLAAARAQTDAAALVAKCAAGDCQQSDVPPNTQACVADEVLRVTVTVPWAPRLYRGLTPATGIHLIDLDHIDPTALLTGLNPPSCPPI